MEIKKLCEASISILILFSLFSCNEKTDFYAYKSIEGSQWLRDSVVRLQIDSFVPKSSQVYTISIELVHTKIYPYKNICFLVGSNINNSSIMRYDTVRTTLMDNYGSWYSRSTGGLHQISIPYKKQTIPSFKTPPKYEIKQLMEDDPLKGIDKIGIKIKEDF